MLPVDKRREHLRSGKSGIRIKNACHSNLWMAAFLIEAGELSKLSSVF